MALACAAQQPFQVAKINGLASAQHNRDRSKSISLVDFNPFEDGPVCGYFDKAEVEVGAIVKVREEAVVKMAGTHTWWLQANQRRAKADEPSMPETPSEKYRILGFFHTLHHRKLDFAMGELHNSRSRSLNPTRSTNVNFGTVSNDVVDSALDAFETTMRHKQLPLHKGG